MKFKKLRSKNFEIFWDRKNFNCIFNENVVENFRDFAVSNFLVDRFQNALTFFIINGFGRDFFQSCVDFHGGHNGSDFRWISEAQCALKHFWHPLKILAPSRDDSGLAPRFGVQNTASSSYTVVMCGLVRGFRVVHTHKLCFT